MRPTAPHRRAALAVGGLLTALSILTLTACGGGASGSSSAHPHAAARRAYAQCLSQHGVTLPGRRTGAGSSAAPAAGGAPGGAGRPRRDMSTPPPGVDQQTWTAARSACASLAPAPPNGGPAPSS